MYRLVVLFFFLLISFQASADDNIHVFSNGRILDDVSNCSIESFDRPFVHVSSSSSNNVPNYENLRSSASRRASIVGRVPVGSLLALQSRSVAPGQRGYISTRIASRSAPRSNFGSIVSRTARGHIWGPSVEKPDKWVFKIIESEIAGESGLDAIFLNDKYLRVVKSGSNYRGVRCCEGDTCKNLAMYSVSENQNGTQVENYVAIHPREMGFIKNMQGTETSREGSTRAPRLSNSSPRVATSPRPAPRTSTPSSSSSGQTTTPVRVHRGSMEKVVCTRGASLNVRNQSLGRVLFSVRKYESVTPYESWSTNRVTRGSHTYVRVRFPRINREGWVAETYIKVGSDCAGYTGGSNSSSTSGSTTSSTRRSTTAGGSTQVVCTRGNSLNVRNSSLNSVIFQAPKYARVSRIGTTTRSGRGHTFINVRFTDLNRDGWVAQNFIAAGSRCRGYNGQNPTGVVQSRR
ncbi:MAG: hypothetical protein MJK18_05935, partial [Bdellovibrionales bacterium]|nr:hypothetical protein [Bdellovibrionales bacterium]